MELFRMENFFLKKCVFEFFVDSNDEYSWELSNYDKEFFEIDLG